MTKKNLKDLVEQIQKFGAPPPPKKPGYVSSGLPKPTGGGGAATPPGGAAVTPGKRVLPGHGGRPTTTAPRGGGGYYAPPAIRDMQTAMQNLAKTISATIDYDALTKSMQPLPPGQTAPPGTEQDKAAFQAQYGKDMFSNFMVGNYLRRADVKGVEYDTDPKRTKMLEKKPSDLKSMFIILDTIKRVGNERRESFADGNWGPRTNNALKNISAIADAIIKLGGELGMESRSFDIGKVKELNGLIPEKDTSISPQEKVARAPKITQILEGVQALFLDFKQQVLMDPTYRNFIEGKAPIMTFGPAKEKGVDASEGERPILADLQQSGVRSRYVNHPDATFSVNLDEKYTGQKVPPFRINAASLVSPEAFEQWINSSTILMEIKKNNPGTWPSIVGDFLNQIDEQVKFLLVGGNQRK